MCVIGLIGSIIAFSLMGDWQAMRSDPCTDKSLFHHPELKQQYLSQLDTPAAPDNATVVETVLCEKSKQYVVLNGTVVSDRYVFETSDEVGMTSSCEIVYSCLIGDQQDFNRNYSICSNCFQLKSNFENHCTYFTNSQLELPKTHQKMFIYFCSMHKFLLRLCVQVVAVLPLTQQENFEKYIEHAHVETVKNIMGKLADVLEETCEDQPHHSCHWNPQSEVTGRYCEDCSPICRDQTNYLQFSQFAIGAALLLFSAEMHKIPIYP